MVKPTSLADLADKQVREEKEVEKQEEKTRKDAERKEKMFSRVRIGVEAAFKKIAIMMGVVTFAMIMLYLLRDKLEFFVGGIIVAGVMVAVMYLYGLSLRDIIMEEVRLEFTGEKK